MTPDPTLPSDPLSTDPQATKEDEAWLAVLAGTTQPADRMSGQANALRDYFELQLQHEQVLDEASQRRLLNILESRGAFDAKLGQQAAAVSLREGDLKRLSLGERMFRTVRDMFVNAGTPRWNLAATAAMIMFAILVAPMWSSYTSDVDSEGDIKSLPNGVTHATTIIDSNDTQQAAKALQNLLMDHGVTAEVFSDGDDRWVIADVSAARREEVQASLVAIGLAMMPSGHLAVMYRKQPGHF